MKQWTRSLMVAVVVVAAAAAIAASVARLEPLAVAATLTTAAAAIFALTSARMTGTTHARRLDVPPTVAPQPRAMPTTPITATDGARDSSRIVSEHPSGAHRQPMGVEPTDVLRALEESVRGAGTVLSTHLWLEDPATATLRLVATYGDVPPSSVPVALVGTLLGTALAQGSARLRRETVSRTGRTEEVVWRYVVPLDSRIARGVVVVDLADGDEPPAAVMNSAAGSLRGALCGALALHVARTETATAYALVEAGQELSRLLDADAVVEAALRWAMLLAQAQTGSIMLVDETSGALRIAASSGLPAGVAEQISVPEGDGIAGWVLASKQPLIVEDLHDRGPRSRRHGVRSAISVLVADDDGALGVLNVGSRAFHAHFSQSHLDALSSIGRMTAVALRNSLAVHSTRELYFDTLKALALALETKDPYARGGTARVVGYACDLAAYLDLSTREAEALRIAALLHDIGMAAAGEMISVANRPLSTVEWGMLKMHPSIAREILAQTPALRKAIPIVYHHHEHFDGSGYAAGLSGERIPLGARILAVADSFVAMTSDRPHRRAMSLADAIAELREHSGTQFDPDVVRAMIELAEDQAGQEIDAAEEPARTR